MPQLVPGPHRKRTMGKKKADSDRSELAPGLVVKTKKRLVILLVPFVPN